jgi:glutathione synthase/RimK-type ligase-like ATP-grasp enzyme
MRRKHNFTKFWFYRYGPSGTADSLADAVNGKLLKLEDSKYRKQPGQLLINWGNSHAFREAIDLNQPAAVAVATSKTRTFDALERGGIPIPDWTTDANQAQQWLETGKILGRDKDTGSGGEGITIYKKGEEIKPHKFYVKYFKKNREFRIHVFKGKVIFVQEKLKKKGVENVNKYIRSHDRGWCFAFNHLVENPATQGVELVGLSSVAALGLDFGAVDLGWHRESGIVVFEVNTAPGLEETSLRAYANAINAL